MNHPNDIKSPEESFFARLKQLEQSKSLDHKNELWQRIAVDARKYNRKKRRRLWISSASVAAVLLLLVSLSTHVWLTNYGSDVDTATHPEELLSESFSDIKEVTLIRHNKEIVATSSQPSIVHNRKGDVQMDGMDVQMGTEKRKDGGVGTPEYNVVVVPKGKQAVLTLSDGSKIRINSRSKVVYPERFSASKREIYVDGEAFLEVVHNAELPFVVKTSQFDVNVLGTSFNVTAYRELSSSQVALVEGSVRVITDEQTTSLEPSQVVSIVNGTIEVPRTADLLPYIGWIDGFVYLQSTPIGDLLSRMSFYYGIPFEWASDSLQLRVSGKLDISRDLSSALNYISQIVPISFTRYENKILVNPAASK